MSHVDHRPWPVPARAWTWRQTWHDLLFLHWTVPAATLRTLVPRPLDIDEFQGAGWVAVTPFWMSDVAWRGWPAVPGASRFPELNVRTYVRLGDQAGVWFFSLDAASRLAVWAARRLYRLPYHYARMTVRERDGVIEYRSQRPSGPAFEAAYAGEGTPMAAAPGTLEHWLTERYRLYARSPSGQIHRAEIHHAPWPLQPAAVTVRRNDMLRIHGIEVGDVPPHARFARRLEVVVWDLER